MAIEKNKRIEGQIWIDKVAPHNLKYYVDETEHTISNVTLYKYDGENIPKAGNIVKMGSGNKIELATFPMDISKVIGVVATTPTTEDTDECVEIIRNGKIEVTPEVFTEAELNYSKEKKKYNCGYNKSQLFGLPVYWSMGRQEGNNEFKNPETGKLTLIPPCGINSDIKYGNLPKVGNIIGYELEEDAIKKIFIHLNFSSFDETIQWFKPIETSDNYSKTIYHGLFTPGIQNIKATIKAFKKDTSSTEEVLIFSKQKFGSSASERGTYIEFASKEQMNIEVSGEVFYGE